MLNKIRKFFKKSRIGNERGSSVTVAFIVIAILTFSMTTITSGNISLAGATDVKLTQVSDENVAKGLINQAISEFELFVDSNEKVDEFNNIEIPRILNDYGVVVTDETSNNPDFGTSEDGHESKIYKFAYTLSNDTVLYKFAYASNGGTSVGDLNPYDFSLATNGKLLMNGGYYDDISLYGNEVLLASVGPYLVDGTTTQKVTPYSSSNDGTYPILSDRYDSSVIYSANSYSYCESITSCFDLNSGNTPFGLLESSYIDVAGSELYDKGEIATESISDFFNGFSYEDFVVDYIKYDAPSRGNEISDPMTLLTAADVVRANSVLIDDFDNDDYWDDDSNWYDDDDSWTDDFFDNWFGRGGGNGGGHGGGNGGGHGGGNGGGHGGGNGGGNNNGYAFVNITDNDDIDFTDGVRLNEYSAFYDGDLTITDDVEIRDGNSLFVNGDLTIDNTSTGWWSELLLDGTFVVTGNLYFIGNSVEIDGTFFVFGETYMQFEYDEGIISDGNKVGFSLINGDNIIIESLFVNHRNAYQPDTFSAFFYTEESIWIDAVNGKMNIEGALFARALGNTDNPIFMNDESNVPVSGIVINSYRGYINYSGNAVPSNR
ncbi:MAG: hypothetical protein J7K80_00175, partial [Candidatus Izimaplasma sp.]|nr:hypothetical protein [Candidatus Izimaplasma bacterium]